MAGFEWTLTANTEDLWSLETELPGYDVPFDWMTITTLGACEVYLNGDEYTGYKYVPAGGAIGFERPHGIYSIVIHDLSGANNNGSIIVGYGTEKQYYR